ncbi:hypothetical protein GGR58DRAFT_526334 [Xylaria digitata]|nr:hypothetical protein GGR58DRAFT_526334 [Xylaria digitata]
MESHNLSPNHPPVIIMESADRQTWVTIHKVLLAHHSQRYRQVLNTVPGGGDFIRIVPPFYGDVLRLFVDWVYSKNEDGVPKDMKEVASRYAFRVFVQAWMFGNYIQAPEFQNAITFYIMCMSPHQSNWFEEMETQWDHISRGTVLESLLLNLLFKKLFESSAKDMKAYLKRLPPNTAQRVI